MGYRGEDVSTTHGAWGHQTPWQSSSDDYQGIGSGGPGYGQGDAYPGQGQPGYAGYGQQDEQYGGPYGQQPHPDQYGQPYRQYDGYETGGGGAGGWGPPGDGWGGTAGGYGGQPEYGQADYGYERGAGPSGYPQGGYGQPPGPGYGPASGYRELPGGYQGQAGGGYPGRDDGGYQDQHVGYGQPGGYQAQQPGGYPALPAGSGGYPAQDAGNDWYGGQPGAERGGSFADTGSYGFNGRAVDEYSTGARGALRDPARGYPPGQQQDPGQVPTSVIPALSGPRPARRNGQQERFEDNAPYPDYGPDGDGYPGPAGREAYNGYDDFGTRTDLAGPGGYRGPGRQAPLPSAGLDRHRDGRDGYDKFQNSGDPYQDPYGDDGELDTSRGPGRNDGKRNASASLSGKGLLLAAVAVVVVGIVAVAAYAFVLKPKSPTGNPSDQGALPTGSAAASQQACAEQLGTYCHIETRTDDPTPLTTAELFPPAFTNEADKTSYSLVSTKLDKTCSDAVIGANLIKQLQGNCSQVLRASYVSGDGKIMGTIGVVNLMTTNEAHDAGRVVGQSDFIAPLTAAKGVASKLGNGTGVVEAEYKGHYLILTWSEFVNGTTPSTKAQDSQLERFSNDLVAGTANIDLSQRMVTGTAPTPAASTSPSASAKASASKSLPSRREVIAWLMTPWCECGSTCRTTGPSSPAGRRSPRGGRSRACCPRPSATCCDCPGPHG